MRLNGAFGRLATETMGRILIFVTLLLVVASGCRFSREIINPHVRNLDTSWIEPGVTTRRQIVARMGFPPTVREMGGVRPDSFRWTMSDTFVRSLEIGYIVTPTFERGHEHFAEDILVAFDPQGVVKRVSRTRSTGDQVEVLEWRECP